jgi:hypothetical protein
MVTLGKARTRPAIGEDVLRRINHCRGQCSSGPAWPADRSGLCNRRRGVPQAVSRHADAFAIVAGQVQHVGVTKAIVWIGFGKIWREDVTVAVARKRWLGFEAAGLTKAGLEGSFIRARGVVTMRDEPRIEITEPAAIEQIAPVVA